MEIDRQQLHNDDDYRRQVIDTLVRDYGDAIMRKCTEWLGEGEAEEIAQEVFVAAYNRLPSYQPNAPIREWLFAIAHKRLQRAYRDRKRRQDIAQRFVKDIRQRVHAVGSTSPEDQVVQQDLCARLPDSLAQLPAEDQILLTLWYWKEVPIAEIADIMRKSTAAIRRRLTRVEQRLKELMDDTSQT
jgi:RNA polymerase sigma-70 factor (ECF subfamily)